MRASRRNILMLPSRWAAGRRQRNYQPVAGVNLVLGTEYLSRKQKAESRKLGFAVEKQQSGVDGMSQVDVTTKDGLSYRVSYEVGSTEHRGLAVGLAVGWQSWVAAQEAQNPRCAKVWFGSGPWQGEPRGRARL